MCHKLSHCSLKCSVNVHFKFLYTPEPLMAKWLVKKKSKLIILHMPCIQIVMSRFNGVHGDYLPIQLNLLSLNSWPVMYI